MEEMVSAHVGIGKDGKPWTETVVVVKPGASDEEIQVAATTAKKLAAQFQEEVEQAKIESLAARFILERFTTREILERMSVEFAGSCPMPIRKFGDVQLSGTIAEVYDEHPEAVKWVGITKALEMMEGAGADKILGVVACGKYWHGQAKPVVKPKEEEVERADNERWDKADSGQEKVEARAIERVAARQLDDYDGPEDDERDLSEPLESEDDWL